MTQNVNNQELSLDGFRYYLVTRKKEISRINATKILNTYTMPRSLLKYCTIPPYKDKYENYRNVNELQDITCKKLDIVYWAVCKDDKVLAIFTAGYKQEALNLYAETYHTPFNRYVKIVYNLTSNNRVYKIQRLYRKYIERKKVNEILTQKQIK